MFGIYQTEIALLQVVHDYAVTGLGYMYVYVDPEADYGRGEVKHTTDPFIYVDPASRDRFLMMRQE